METLLSENSDWKIKKLTGDCKKSIDEQWFQGKPHYKSCSLMDMTTDGLVIDLIKYFDTDLKSNKLKVDHIVQLLPIINSKYFERTIDVPLSAKKRHLSCTLKLAKLLYKNAYVGKKGVNGPCSTDFQDYRLEKNREIGEDDTNYLNNDTAYKKKLDENYGEKRLTDIIKKYIDSNKKSQIKIGKYYNKIMFNKTDNELIQQLDNFSQSEINEAVNEVVDELPSNFNSRNNIQPVSRRRKQKKDENPKIPAAVKKLLDTNLQLSSNGQFKVNTAALRKATKFKAIGK